MQGPYTPYLTDYTAPGSQQLLVQLRVNDPTLAEYRCKLRVTIEGVGITLRTKQSFIPDPIVLSGGGIPEIFYGADLASYFDPANLDFAGFSRAEFNQSARLPEGIYRFTIEVLDYNKNIVVSNAGTAMAWIILNDPPILNLPRNETKLQLIDPTNIVFTWTPRHRGSPNAALTTEYIFRLVEIWPANRNPYDAFLTQPPLYETTTDMQQLLYGPAEPALIPGRKYAWQVQAVDVERRDLFKNQGHSEVFVFQYGDELTAPENLRLQSANPTNLTVRWDQVTGGTAATNFRVQYREHRNRSSNEWYETQTTDQWRAIPQLKSDTEYEVQVRAEQQFQVSPYTVVQVFRTLTPGENEFVCRDDAPPPPLPSSTTPLFELAINDTIKAGGYNVLVRSVTGGSGTYSGEGMAIIPYLNGAKVRVTFENIRVNGQNMLTAGVIKSFWNPYSKFLLEVETPTLPGQMPSAGEIPVTIVATETLIEITGAAIATVSEDEDGNIVVHTTDGQQQTLEKGETYSVVDEQGNGYVIDDQGNIAKTTAAEARAAHDRGNRTYNLALTFAKGDGKLGFDDLPIRTPGQFSVLHPHYQQVDGTFIPWKAVTSSAQDGVTVIPDNAEMDLTGIRFEVSGVTVQPQNNSGNIKLNLYGKTGGMVEELIATTGDDEQSEVLGKLNLVSYDGITKNVVIVPVNNADLPAGLGGSEISNRLTEIFQQAVAKVQVSIAPNLTVTLDDTFDDGESGMLSNYTGDMKKVINAFGNIQDDTYYLFLVEKPKSGGAALGFMPRSKQVGFIFADNLANDAHAVRTMAHELSHGMFNLKHTFSEFTALSEGTTQNLMDYSASGTDLLKYQWDYVHHPQRVVPLFEGDEEGEMSLPCVGIFDDCDEVLEILNVIKSKVASNSNLILFKPNPERNRKERYEGTSLAVGDEDYSKIVILNELESDDMVDPKIFYGLASKLEEDEYEAGFMYTLEDSSNFKILVTEEEDSVTTFAKTEKLRQYLFGDLQPAGGEGAEETTCASGFCCTKCGKDLAMTEARFTELFPRVGENKQEYVDAFNVSLQESGFEYNTCDRQAKIFAQISIETNNLTATTEGKGRTWELTGRGQLLDYFKATAKAKIRWFNQAFWSTKLYKQFSQRAYYEKIEDNETIIKSDRYSPTDTIDCYGTYKGEIQPQFLVQIPIKFVKDTVGQFKKYKTPSLAEKAQIEKNIFNYAYGDNLGNGDYLTSDDGFTYRGRGAIQLTGKASYIALNNKLKAPPYNEENDIVTNPDAIAEIPRLVIYSAFIHFKSQLNNNIQKLDELEIDKVSALINTGKEDGTANHSPERTAKYNTLISGTYKCDEDE